MSQPLFLLGDGGYAPEAALIARAMDPLGERWDEPVFLGPGDEEAALVHGGNVVLAVGTPHLRLRLWETYSAQQALKWPTLIHPRADIGPSSIVGRGACISSDAILTTRVVIEEAVLVNLNVGAGAVVTKDVAASTTVVGIPARPLTRGHEQ